MRRRGAARTVATAVLGLAAAAADRPTVERAIAVPRPGRVAAVLDRDVYESARADLGDLRIVDGEDQPVPYLLDRVGEEPPEVPFTPRLTRTEDKGRRETLLTLDLGARHQPFRAVILDVADPRFFRGVTLEARALPRPNAAAAPPPAWRTLAECPIYRYEESGRIVENLRLEAPGRERTIRLRIHNRDDAPLSVRGVSVGAPVERLVFEAAPGTRYRLRYGAPGLGAPVYDLPQTTGDVGLWAAHAEEGRLQPPLRLPEASNAPPWTERHPALLWAGLIATVVILGLVTRRALHAAS